MSVPLKAGWLEAVKELDEQIEVVIVGFTALSGEVYDLQNDVISLTNRVAALETLE